MKRVERVQAALYAVLICVFVGSGALFLSQYVTHALFWERFTLAYSACSSSTRGTCLRYCASTTCGRAAIHSARGTSCSAALHRAEQSWVTRTATAQA
jgi:hypothetical protein